MKGHVRKRGKKWCFVLDVGIDPNTGKRKQRWFSGFTTKREAEQALNQKLVEVQKGQCVEPSKITLEEYLNQWLNNYAKNNCAPRTLEGYEYVIYKHLIPSLGKVALEKLKPIDIQNYYTQKLKNGRMDGKGGLSQRSVLHHHRILHEALEFAVKWQLIPINPVKAVTAPKAHKQEMNVLTREQLLELLEHAKERSFYPIVFVAVHTGMRRGEIFGLRWSDIDFKNRTLNIHQTLQRLKKQGYVIRKTAKTNKSRRTIAVTQSVIQLLEQVKLKQEQAKIMLGSDYQDNDLVFATPSGLPMDMENVTRKFARLVKRLDIPYIRFHDLRHCHATILMQQGIHPKVVSERLGHSSIKFTMDTYTHVMPHIQKEAVRELDNFFSNERMPVRSNALVE